MKYAHKAKLISMYEHKVLHKCLQMFLLCIQVCKILTKRNFVSISWVIKSTFFLLFVWM